MTLRDKNGTPGWAAHGTRRAGAASKVSLALLIALLPCRGLAQTADEPDSDRISRMFSAAREQALELKSDMQALDFFAGSESGWESHALIVRMCKDHIEGIRRQVSKLDDARTIASPLQKATIDRIAPLLQELAADADALIKHISQNPKRLNNGEYKNYLKVNVDLAAQLAVLVGTFIDYGITRQQIEQLARRLDLPAGTF